jgi:hypothetical protein
MKKGVNMIMFKWKDVKKRHEILILHNFIPSSFVLNTFVNIPSAY